MSPDPTPTERPASRMRDVEKLARQARRDEVARRALLGAVRPTICRWALTQTGDADVAEDVAQDVLLRVHRSLHAFDGRSRFATWLYRIVTNAVRDDARRAQREQRHRNELLRSGDATRKGGRNPATAMDPDRMESLLRVFLSELSPRQRAAFELVDLQGYSGTEAAEMEQIDPATLRVHLARARQSVRDAIRARPPLT